MSEALEAVLSLGALLVDDKRFVEARAHYQRALLDFPEAAGLWCNVGVLHTCCHEDIEAERCFRKALALDGTCSKARFNLSYLLLREGRWTEGWEAYESRAWNLAMRERIPAPHWEGESLAGKALLIGPEGGFGDTIQFCRYVPLLKGMGAARIGLICRPELQRLLQGLSGLDEVVVLGDPIPEPEWDFWTLPMSLPLRCGTRLDAVPADLPYLRARPEWAEPWESRLPGGGLRVGLAWRGNPVFENDEARSLPGLESLAPLLTEAVHFVSLQFEGPGLPETADLVPFDPSPWVQDFADTAGLLTHLDLVISVDTAVAHLAGALGRPCWVLLPHHKTDWRWLKEGSDSPWYPGVMRLFRQGPGEGWAPVLERVAGALRAFGASAG